MFLNNRETKAPSQCLNKFHHDLLLNFSEESLFEGTDRTFNNVDVQLPFPVVKPKGNLEAFNDLVVTLLENKKEYLTLLESKRQRYKYDLRNIIKKKIGKNKFVYLPRHLLEFYQMKDPDQYFQCDYNYYYTGGNLEYFEIDGKAFLIYPDSNNEIFLLDVQSPEHIKSVEFILDSPVHNISVLNNSSEKIFVVRGKHVIQILKMDENKQAASKWKFEYKVPVLDAKLKTDNLSHIGIIWANGNLNVNNVETNQILLHYKSFKDKTEEISDYFQQFEFFDNNLLYVMDRYKMKILDYRTKSVDNVFDPKVIKCNSLCNFKILDNSLLLASRHYIMKTDIRYLKNVTSYSHTLDTPPCYMDIISKNEDVYLAVSSHKQNSKVLFTGKAPYSLPYKVPNIVETLEETMLFDPTLILHLEDFKKRLKHSITGLKILNLNGDISIFTCNSLGEIFKQQVFEENVDNKKSLEVLSSWLKTVEIPEPTLYLTCVEEMSGVRFALDTPPKLRKLKRYNQKSKADKFFAKYEQRYHKKNVTSDWAKQFISVWDDTDDTDEEDPIDNLPEVPVTDKVEGWIQEQEFARDVDSFLEKKSDSVAQLKM